MTDFFERCAAAGCFVVPVKVYSDYVDENIDESKFVGIRFAVLKLGDNILDAPWPWSNNGGAPW